MKAFDRVSDNRSLELRDLYGFYENKISFIKKFLKRVTMISIHKKYIFK